MPISVSTTLLLITTVSLVNSFNLSIQSKSNNAHKKSENVLQSPFHIRPGLDELAEKQQDIQLQLNLDIGMNNENSFTIRDMVLEFQKSLPKGEEDYTMLPGANGWCKNISSQRRCMKLLQPGSFIDMKGEQHIDVYRPSWEMIWPQETPSGSLVMGFELPQDYSRNEYSTTFTSGNIYLRFPIWSKLTLAFGQAKRQSLVVEHDRLYQQKKEALDLCNECRFNPIHKMFHLRHAITIDDKLEDTIKALEAAGPDLSSERGGEYNKNMVMKLKDNLYVSKVGLIYRQKGKFDGESNHEKIGTAHLVKLLSSTQEDKSFGAPITTTTSSRRRLCP